MGNQQASLQLSISSDGLFKEEIPTARKYLKTDNEFNNFLSNMGCGIKEHMSKTNLSEAITKRIRREIYRAYKNKALPNGFKQPPLLNPLGNYGVNKNGVVINTDTRIIMSKHKNKKGYDICNVSFQTDDNNIAKSMSVHRLVAKTFIPNPENKSQVNHINGIKDDNRAENLEWVTNDENMDHAKKNGLMDIAVDKISGTNNYNSRMDKDLIDSMRYMHKYQKISGYKLAKIFNLSYSGVKRILSYKSYRNN